MGISGYTRVNITIPTEEVMRFKLYKEEKEKSEFVSIELSGILSGLLDNYLTEKGYPEKALNNEAAEIKIPLIGQNKVQITKICNYCEKEFKTTNPKAKFCKDACKSANYRKRKKEL